MPKDQFSHLLDVDPYKIVRLIPDEPRFPLVDRGTDIEHRYEDVAEKPQPCEPHPVLVRIWRRPLEDDLARLTERVRLYGQREHIELVDGLIVAGWAEYEACIKAGVPPRFEEIDAPRSVVEYIVRRNIPEQMSPLDRACVAVLAYQEAAKEEGRERMREGGRLGGSLKGKGQDEIARPFEKDEKLWFKTAAKVVGCSANAVKAMAAFYNKPGTRDLFEAVRKRQIMKLSDAKQLAGLVKEPRQRREVLAIFVSGRYAESGAPMRRAVSDFHRRERPPMADGPAAGQHYRVYEGPLETEGLKVKDGTVDAIYADLVYGDPVMAENIGRLAARVLVPGGLVAIVNGNRPFRPVLDALERHLVFVTTGSIHLDGGAEPIPNRVLRADALPVFFLCKGETVLRPITHLHYESKGREKDLHTWQKTLDSTLDIVRSIADEGSVVLDPCSGSGTTGEAALRHKCSFIGIDIDPEAARATRGRLQKVERELTDAGGKSKPRKTKRQKFPAP
jgi:SAM-dependent methyltransferase